jgi:hypothetical protein
MKYDRCAVYMPDGSVEHYEVGDTNRNLMLSKTKVENIIVDWADIDTPVTVLCIFFDDDTMVTYHGVHFKVYGPAIKPGGVYK